MMQYPINEIFQSLQGEGFFTGLPAIFLRMQGCRIGCSWCDTKHTWLVDIEQNMSDALICSPNKKNTAWALMSASAILDTIKQQGYTAKHIVITGGEPCQYDLSEMTEIFCNQGYNVQIETSGTLPLQVDDRVWVTVSPKLNMKGGLVVQKTALLRANEIKHPVLEREDIEKLDSLLKDIDISDKHVLLQPVSQCEDASRLAMQVCIERNWRLSLQTHKYLSIR